MNRVVKALIADDEPISRKVLREELALLPEVKLVGEAENGREALEQIADQQPDLVFLDLQMPLMGGLEVVQHLNGTQLPVIVIVAGFQERGIEALDASAIEYLVKPVTAVTLLKVVERAKALLDKPQEIAERLAKIAKVADKPKSVSPKLVGRADGDYYLVDVDEVLALQGEGDLVWIVTRQRRLLTNLTLRSLESRLAFLPFQRVHRNAIVNISHVRKVSALPSHRWMLTLSNDLQLVVSKRQAHHIRRILEPCATEAAHGMK